MSNNKIIQLEGSGTPDVLLNANEEVLMDVSQGFRDLGLKGLILRHKGRLIVTSRRAIYFRKKTRDYEIQQMNMQHAGYVSMGYNLNFRQLMIGLAMAIVSIVLFSEGSGWLGFILLVLSLIIIFTSRVQGLILSGSGAKIIFSTKSVPARQLSRIITITSASISERKQEITRSNE